jgi:Endopolygalacturonase
VVVTGEGTLDCDAENGDWWVNPKVKRIAWRPRAVAAVDSENVCLHGITVQNSYSWTIHPIFVKHLDLLNFNINNPYNAPNTDGIDPESCEYIRIIGMNIHVGDRLHRHEGQQGLSGHEAEAQLRAHRHPQLLLDKGHGGIVIGSEMSGGVKDMV